MSQAFDSGAFDSGAFDADDTPVVPVYPLGLLFRTPDAGGALPVEVVFGDEDAEPGDYVLAPAGRITRLRGHATVRVRANLAAHGRITRLRGHAAAAYDINVDRPLAKAALQGFQQGRATSAPSLVRFERAAGLQAAVAALWQDGRAVGVALVGRWERAQGLERAVASRFEAARGLAVAPVASRFEQGQGVRRVAVAAFEQARRTGRAPLASAFEQGLQRRRLVLGTMQAAAPRSVPLLAGFRDGVGLRLVRASAFEQARKPPPGRTHPTEPPQPEPCYVPELPQHLVFDVPADAGQPLHLVFLCDGHGGPGPDPDPPQFVIPLLKVYMTVHTIAAVLLPSLEPVQLSELTLDADDDGFGWSISAGGPEHLIDQLAPVAGLPCRIRVTVDGIDWVFAVLGRSRARRFNERRAQISGRSVTALLDAPYMPQQTWLNAGARTAQQLVNEALQFTGVDVGWDIADWLVPAGAWSFQGTPLGAVMRVAESVGAVVRSHRTDAQLHFHPRYPSLPWAWPSATANVQMPGAIITTDDLQIEPRPAYEAVYLSGMAQGQSARVRRDGTAGTLLAAPVTDALLTHVDALRQRGEAILGAGGNKQFQTMTLPLLTGGTNPGLINPGYLIEVIEPGETWRGLVRGIRVTAREPVVRQTINVERSA